VKTKKNFGKHRPVVIKTKEGWFRSKKSRLFKEPTSLKGDIMAGLPKKYAKMGFKRGWAAYKRHGMGFEGSRKRGRGSKKIHHAVMLGGDMSLPALIQRPVHRLSAITPGKIFAPLIDLGLLFVGMVLSGGAKKVIPIKNPHLMNGAQSIVGVGGSLLTKNRFVKMPLLGVALQSTISELKLLFPKLVPLAGDDEVLYLPVEDGAHQLEMQGTDDRIGAVIDGDGYGVPYEIPMGESDDRMGAVMDGEEGGYGVAEGVNH
jgi:hypothetical protein